MTSLARDSSCGRPFRGTVDSSDTSVADHHPPLHFEADGIPVVTPTVAAALARIVRALRAAQTG
jgi:hypothetical protein